MGFEHIFTFLGSIIKSSFISWVSGKLQKFGDSLLARFRKNKTLSPQAKKIISAFNDYSSARIRGKHTTIKGLGHILRKEVSEIQTLWAGGVDGVLLIGQGGSGKSGIATDIAKDLRTKGTPFLYINSRELSPSQDPAIYLPNRMSLNLNLGEAFAVLGKEKECILIVDQLDNINGTEAFTSIVSLMNSVAAFEGVRVLGVCRTFEAIEETTLKSLDFSLVESLPLLYDEVNKCFAQLGISEPSKELLEIGRNLLDLSIISEVISYGISQQEIIRQVYLWEKFVESISEREGRETLDFAYKLAKENFLEDKTDFPIPFTQIPTFAKLFNRNVLIPSTAGRFKIRHQQLRDFLIAYFEFPRRNPIQELINQYGKYNSGNILFWLYELYRYKASNELASFLESILLSNEFVPFYTQTAFLSRYIKEIDPINDAKLVETILRVLKTNEGLSQYFFSNFPASDWAQILWDAHFFENPPEHIDAGNGYISFKYWDVQEYLIGVADKVPEYVLKHIQCLESNFRYTSRALLALSKLEASEAVKGIDRVIYWMNNPELAGGIVEEVYDYLVKLIQGGELDAALTLFREYTKPVRTSEFGTIASRSGTSGPVVTLFDNALSSQYQKVNVLSELTKRFPKEIATIFFEHLGVALRLEAEYLKESPEYTSEVGFELTSWWRVAVEETGQDLDNSAKDKLLKKLLAVLDHWCKNDIDDFHDFLLQLLSEKRMIFYRVGLFLLQTHGSRLPLLVQDELLKFENLDKTEIRHEFFLLLANGFQLLNPANQERLLKHILSGPPEERRRLYEDAYSGFSSKDEYSLDRYIEDRINLWIRDRLWMIQKHLSGECLDQLNTFLEKYGEPEHPTFTRWMSGGGWVKSISPRPENELEALAPEQLLEYIRNWKPERNRDSIFEERNYGGLAQEVAKVIYKDTTKYSSLITTIAKIRPVIAVNILEHFQKAEAVTVEQWEIIVRLCEELLSDESIRTNMDHSFEDSWIRVRLSIAGLIETGFEKKTHHIPILLLERIRNILIILIDDPDPDNEPLPELDKSFGMKDPLTVSLNHVRPNALSTLIDYAVFRVNSKLPGDRLEMEVKVALERKLDKTQDKSNSVRSVFGTQLPQLYWLDKKWVQENIDNIFPVVQDVETLWHFQSAWDAYIYAKPFYTDLRDLLLPKYFLAIETLSYGFVTRRDIVVNFAAHLVMDYLLGDYPDDFLNNERIPLLRFFKKVKPEDRAKAAGAIQSYFSHHQNEISKWWPKVRPIIEWRVREAVSGNHSSEFDEEMRNIAELIEFVPASENINTLWSLLQELLPHIVNLEYRDRGWDSIEKYLAQAIVNHPLPCIKLYRMMREQRKDRLQWHRESTDARKIIETGAMHSTSCKEALALIDFLARSGNHAYRDIYDRYSTLCKSAEIN